MLPKVRFSDSCVWRKQAKRHRLRKSSTDRKPGTQQKQKEASPMTGLSETQQPGTKIGFGNVAETVLRTEIDRKTALDNSVQPGLRAESSLFLPKIHRNNT